MCYADGNISGLMGGYGGYGISAVAGGYSAGIETVVVTAQKDTSPSATEEIVIGGLAVAAGAIGLAVFTPELLTAIAAGEVLSVVTTGSLVGISAIDGALGGSYLFAGVSGGSGACQP